MIRLHFSVIVASALLLGVCACTEIVEVEVSYQKGTPIYGDLSAIRSTPLLAQPRSIENPGKIFVAEDFLLVGEEGQGIHVIDNSNEENPRHTAFLNIPGNREFFFSNDVVYAESYYDMLKIDLSNPANPVLISRLEESIADILKNNQGQTLLGFEFERVTEKLDRNDDIYQRLNNGVDYLLYDYENNLIPASAVPASFAGNSNNDIGSVNRIVKHKDHVYAVSRSNLMVFSDEAGFEKVSHMSIGWEIETVFPLDDFLYLGAQSEVLIVDVSTPQEPMHTGSFWHATSCDPVFPTSDGVAYVTLRSGGENGCPGDDNLLLVLRIEEPSSPEIIEEIAMKSPYGLTKKGNELYVSEGEHGFKIFDASDPRNLTLKKSVENIAAYDVLFHPTRADLLLIAGPGGLRQYQVDGSYHLLSTLPY